MVIADFIGQSWKILTQLLDDQTTLQTVWLMMVALVQDVDEGVRASMCLALQDKLMLLEDDCPSVLCQQTTLHRLILLIPSMYEPRVAIPLLKLLLEANYSQPMMSYRQDPVSALLFKEDHTNSYAEPVLLLNYITEAFSEVCRGADGLRDVIKLELDPLVKSHAPSDEHLQNDWSLDTAQCYQKVQKAHILSIYFN